MLSFEVTRGLMPKRPSSAMPTLLLLFAALVSGALAQEQSAPPHKSVYGKLQSVDTSKNGVIMKSDAGERLAWRFDAAVIAEAARFKPGDPMIVIYKQLSSSQKAVTALAFPGAAEKPVYINLTGARVVLRSAPAVGGVCGKPDAGPVSESTIPIGGRAEALEACWCCAPSGEACTTGNKSGAGQAFLVRCFQ